MTEDYVTEHPVLDAIKEYICTQYKLLYTGRSKLFREGNVYVLHFNLNNDERPIILAGDFSTDADFINYFKREFRNRSLYNTKYFSAFKVMPDSVPESNVKNFKDGHC